MSEPFDERTRSRIQMLYIYMQALHQGDMETTLRILHTAEQDAVLERILLEAHEASIETSPPVDVSPIYELLRSYDPAQGENERTYPPDAFSSRNENVTSDPRKKVPAERSLKLMSTETPSYLEKPSTLTKRTGKSKRSRLTLLVQSLAAILIVGVLISGFIFLFHSHQGLQAGQGISNNSITTASSDGTIFELSDNGQILWSYETQGMIQDMVQQDEVVYISTSSGRNTYLYKFDRRSGQVLWKETVVLQLDFAHLFIGTDALAVDGTDAFEVVNTSNGSLLWKSDHEHDLEVLTVSHDVLYTFGIKAFQLSSGKLLWSVPMPNVEHLVFSQQVINALAFTSDHTMTNTLINPANGQQTGIITYTNMDQAILSAGDTTTFYALQPGLPTEKICAMHFLDNKASWCLPYTLHDLIDGWVRMDNTLYEMHHPGARRDPGSTYNEQLNALDSNGKQTWQTTLGPLVFQGYPMEITGNGGTLYVETAQQGLFALSGNDGHVLWQALNGQHIVGVAGSDPAQTTEVNPL